MKRRHFLKWAGLSLSMTAVNQNGHAFFEPRTTRTARTIHSTRALRDYFVWDDESVIALVESIFEKCIFEKILPPEGELKRRWIAPGGWYYGQWLWDTMFVVDLLSLFDEQKELIREIFGNYRDFQDRWNPLKPDYMHDMITCVILGRDNKREWVKHPVYSQIPIIAWGLERVYNRNKDRQLLLENLSSLEKFHEWYWRERDVTNVGLVGVGAYSEDIQHARWETFDHDGTLDHLKLTPHPTRRDDPPKNMYGDVLVVGNTSYLILAEQSLARLSRIVGDEAMALRREQRLEKAVEAVRRYMWDEKSGYFKGVKRDTLEKIDELSIGCWMPLLAGIPTKKMAEKMADALATEAWMTPLPVPTLPATDPRFEAAGFWRGDVWPVTNYQIAAGFKAYGYDDLAAHIADATIANALKNGVNERHNALTGEGVGVKMLGMSCTIATMMLEGFSKKYRLQLK